MKKAGPSYSIIGNEKSFTGKPIKPVKLDKEKGAKFSFKPNKLVKNKLKKLIASKPLLVDLLSYNSLGFNSNLVGFDNTQLSQDVSRPMSPRLLNWVEPYEISGVRKTLFYTEVNSGLKVGDRVFIINGNYDSDLLIKKNKYKRGRDGYKVLFVDKCQVVLDIDYTDVKPYSEEKDDDYINVYYLNSEDDFRWAEKSFTTKTGTFSRKFNYYQNNIVYTNKNYGPINIWGLSTKIQEAPGFFVRNTSDTLGLDNSLDIGLGFGPSNSIVNTSNQIASSIPSNITSNTLLQIYNQWTRLLVGGSFSSYNGVGVSNIVALTNTGDIDTTFLLTSGFNGPVLDIKNRIVAFTVGPTSYAVYKYYIVGGFTTYNGSNARRIVRLHLDGSIDTSFSVGTTLINSGEIRTILLLPGPPINHNIVIGGNFPGGIRMLNSINGSVVSAFNYGTGFNGPVNSIKQDPLTGRLIVAGEFTSYNGQSALRIAQLDLNGIFDPSGTFNAALGSGFGGTINDIVYTTNNKILAVGEFDSFDGIPYGGIVSIYASGSVDNSFVSGSGFDGSPKSIAGGYLTTSPGKIFIGGSFTTYNGDRARQLVRLNSNGTIDKTFSTGFGLTNGVKHINLVSNNNIYIGGDFSTYNGVSKNKFAKISVTPWTNITSDFIEGSFSYALSSEITNNGKVKIHNGGFTYSINGEVVEFKEGESYKFDMSEEPNAIRGSFSTWVVDVTSSRPILTKTNFRDGNFNGVWNVGVFGRQNKKIKWTGEKSIWNTGTLLNSIWEKGNLKSINSLSESYLTEFDEFGLPSQKLNTPNNGSRGFNYIIDSEIKTGVIDNGILINSKIGSDTATFSAVESILISSTISNTVEVKKASFEDTSLNNSVVKNSELKNVRVKNSVLENVKSVNSYLKKSYMKNSDYISDEIIKILDYDEFNISEYVGNIGASHKVYKFYISEKDYNRFRLNDSFYLKGIKFNNGDKSLINFFDKRFKIGSWNEYTDSLNEATNINPANYSNSKVAPTDTFYKRAIDSAAFLSTLGDNKFTYNTISRGFTYSTSIVSENTKKLYSIDVVFSLKDRNFNPVSDLNFNRDINSTTLYGTNSIKFKYTSFGAEFEEIVSPKGYYNSKPYYEINENTGIPQGYVFWDISGIGAVNTGSYSWQHYQSFATSSGGFGQYYSTLEELGDLPLTSTYSWQTAINPNRYIVISEVYNPTPQISNTIASIIDINNAFIIDSDYESGLVERTNWKSGYLISPSNDSNLTVADSIGGYYNLQILTQSSSILVETTKSNLFREREEEFYQVGDVVYLNSVDYDTTGQIFSWDLITSGTGYISGEVIGLSGSGTGSVFGIIESGGGVISTTLTNPGFGYKVGDVITLLGGNSNSFITVLSVTGSKIRLPDTYKITSKVDNLLTIQEIYATNSQISKLIDGGLFYTTDANNRYGYLHSVKFKKNLIRKGFLQRVYLYNNLMQNKELNLTDKDFSNLSQFRDLLIADALFTNNKNILSKASYVNSSFIMGNDIWNDGLFYNSIWNKGIFTKGLVKNSTWLDGKFESGLFYESRSFNALADSIYRYYDTDRIKSYYKSGITSATLSNNRFSWRTGTFSTGEFLKSDWEHGIFKNGKFYNSKWYSGTFSNGTIGDISLSVTDTWFYNGLIKTAIVENANLYAIDTSYLGLSTSAIVWETGVFNAGVFGCDILIQSQSHHTALWKEGTFNGGEFQTNGKWLDGTFNNGKFISAYGWTFSPSITQLSTSQSQFGWEDGVFNGGQFGTADRATNSTWWSGEFNGGKFQGRIWSDGVFTKGEFLGGSTYSAVGGYDVDVFDRSNANDFVLSFTSDFWGIWRNGIVTLDKDEFFKDKKTIFEKNRVINIRRSLKTVKFSNMLWQGGTVSHPLATLKNSVWIDGQFVKGNFKESAFNPYVQKQGILSPNNFNLNDDLVNGSGSCVWYGGNLEQSDFYISQWYDGNFISGTAFGMVWKDGRAIYMNAYNIFWENGLWRNGNWFGSYIKVEPNGDILNPFHKQLLLRGMNWSGTSSSHLWNVFESVGDTYDRMGVKNTTSSISYTDILVLNLPPKGKFKFN